MLPSPRARLWSRAGAYLWMIAFASFIPGRLACVVGLAVYVVETTPFSEAPFFAALSMNRRFAETLLRMVNGFQLGMWGTVASAAIDAAGVAKITSVSAPWAASAPTCAPTTGAGSVTLYDSVSTIW